MFVQNFYDIVSVNEQKAERILADSVKKLDGKYFGISNVMPAFVSYEDVDMYVAGDSDDVDEHGDYYRAVVNFNAGNKRLTLEIAGYANDMVVIVVRDHDDNSRLVRYVPDEYADGQDLDDAVDGALSVLSTKLNIKESKKGNKNMRKIKEERETIEDWYAEQPGSKSLDDFVDAMYDYVSDESKSEEAWSKLYDWWLQYGRPDDDYGRRPTDAPGDGKYLAGTGYNESRKSNRKSIREDFVLSDSFFDALLNGDYNLICNAIEKQLGIEINGFDKDKDGSWTYYNFEALRGSTIVEGEIQLNMKTLDEEGANVNFWTKEGEVISKVSPTFLPPDTTIYHFGKVVERAIDYTDGGSGNAIAIAYREGRKAGRKAALRK